MGTTRTLAILCTLAVSGCLSLGPGEDDPLNAALDVQIQWQPAVPLVGEPVDFAAAIRSNQPGDNITRLQWRIEDAIYDDARPTHVFLLPGEQAVAVVVETTLTGISRHEATVQVLPDDTLPPPTDELAIVARVTGADVRFSFSWTQQPDIVSWDFGDGATSSLFHPSHTYTSVGTYSVTLRASSPDAIQTATTVVSIASVPASTAQPHVIVAVPDSGINPYHDIYRRPDLTAHPCTYIPDFPCSVQELRLTLNAPNYAAALQLDEAVWSDVRSGTWYWIPGTAFVAVSCDAEHNGRCILDDAGDSHGTGTTSSVITENPDVLLAFREGGPSIGPFRSAGIPADIFSVSWGHVDPLGQGLSFGYPLTEGLCNRDDAPLYIKAAGNDPGPSILTDCWSGDPDVITVGGASAQDDSQFLLAGKDMDVVSYYCRPVASPTSLDLMRPSGCGTSFSAPTVAGALSKVILAVRMESGYQGGLAGKVLDPISGLTTTELREALNVTASYSPSARFSTTASPSAPLNPAAPWTQWGWGFYDSLVADATIDHLLGTPAPAKPAAAVAYMEAQYALRETLYG